MQLQHVFSEADEITIYRDGENVVYGSGDGQFKNICAEWDDMLKDSVVMPAFGVSINSYTVNAMKSGVWVEFGFSRSSGCCYEHILLCSEDCFASCILNASQCFPARSVDIILDEWSIPCEYIHMVNST